MNNAMRWALVTAAAGITCGTLGHYLPAPAAVVAVCLIAGFFALFGFFAIEGANND